MAKYNIPQLIELMDIPEFQKLQASVPHRILDETDIVTMCFRGAIHWISIYQIFWPPFEEKDFYFVDVSSLVQSDPDREQLPEKFYEQLAVILKTFWTIQLEDLYPEGDWQVEIFDENGLVVQAFVFDRIGKVNLEKQRKRYRIPRLFSLKDIPKFQRLQARNPDYDLDERDCAVLYGRASHWMSIYKILWPDFRTEDFYMIELYYIVDYDSSKKQTPDDLYKQIAQLLETFWTIQLNDLYPDGDWLVENCFDLEDLVQATIYRRC